MRIACIIQARLGSKRLPGKVLMDIGGRPMIWHVVKRALDIHVPVIVACPHQDSPQIGLAIDKLDAQCVPDMGEENDVLARYYWWARGYDVIMRLTGDCPLIDPAACRKALAVFIQG